MEELLISTIEVKKRAYEIPGMTLLRYLKGSMRLSCNPDMPVRI